MKLQAITSMAAVAMLTACASSGIGPPMQALNLCYTQPGKPSNKNPAPPNARAREQKNKPTFNFKTRCDADNVFSVIFQNGVPTGVGGGKPLGTDLERNNKEVERGKAYCWVATNDQGEPIDMDFAILFSPNDDPTNQKSWAKVTVRRDLQVETEYKYTIWASNKIEENRTACGIMDPIFLIN